VGVLGFFELDLEEMGKKSAATKSLVLNAEKHENPEQRSRRSLLLTRARCSKRRAFSTTCRYEATRSNKHTFFFLPILMPHTHTPQNLCAYTRTYTHTDQLAEMLCPADKDPLPHLPRGNLCDDRGNRGVLCNHQAVPVQRRMSLHSPLRVLTLDKKTLQITLRRMVYLVIKELSGVAQDVIIVTSSLQKDMNAKADPVYRANAIRSLCKITDVNPCVLWVYACVV